MGDSERSGADTRARIMQVAEEEFAREGYSGAHLQAIAERVGVQKTALYYYFDSKAALYEAVLTRMIGAFDDVLVGVIDGPGTPRERLEALLDTVNDLLARYPTWSRILVRVFVDRLDYGAVDELRAAIEGLVGRLFRFHREGVDAGAFVKRSSRHMFQSLLGAMVFHYATGALGGAVLDVDDIFADEVVTWRGREVKHFVLRAVLRDPPAD